MPNAKPAAARQPSTLISIFQNLLYFRIKFSSQNQKNQMSSRIHTLLPNQEPFSAVNKSSHG
jgi:hypothetical protein